MRSTKINDQKDKEKLSAKIVQYLRNIEPVSEFQLQVVDPIARLCGEETLAQSIGRALSQGVNLYRLQHEINELEAIADAIEKASCIDETGERDHRNSTDAARTA